MVGVDQGSGIGALPVVGERDGLEVRYGTLGDGFERIPVLNYLRDAFWDRRTVIQRYDTAPEVRIIGSATSVEASRAAAAVQLVNAALPSGSKMSMGASMPDFSLRDTVDTRGYYYPSGQELENVIHVEFVPSGEYYDVWTAGTTWRNDRDDNSIRSSYIQANGGPVPGPYSASDETHVMIMLAHELLHALGLDHISPLADTINEEPLPLDGIRQPSSILYPYDREALQALYGQLESGGRPEDLGPWESTSRHIAGRGEHAAFGVALRNGYAEPWAYGYMPASDLADNAALAGTATWEGTLLGFTPEGAPVAGNVEVGVNLSDLNGQADFTTLESWALGASPGDPGTGTLWGDGDLAYSISVNGNTFRQTGGDDGILTGAFLGENHEGVGGTLERDDLTAAFGAGR